jgi:putative sterol carrier protein
MGYVDITFLGGISIMKYEEIVQLVRDSVIDADVSDYKKHLAVQFNVTGEGEGIFYLEIKDGAIYVEPYDYHDNDVVFEASAETLVSIMNGTLDCTKAYLSEQIKVSDIPRAIEVQRLIDDVNKKKAIKAKEAEKKAKADADAKKKAETKTATTKATATKSTAKKSTAKKTK